MSKHRTAKSVREMRGVPETLKRQPTRAARKARNGGRQEMEEGKKWRKARNGDVKPAPLVSRRTASHALYPTELNFPLEYRSMALC